MTSSNAYQRLLVDPAWYGPTPGGRLRPHPSSGVNRGRQRNGCRQQRCRTAALCRALAEYSGLRQCSSRTARNSARRARPAGGLRPASAGSAGQTARPRYSAGFAAMSRWPHLRWDQLSSPRRKTTGPPKVHSTPTFWLPGKETTSATRRTPTTATNAPVAGCSHRGRRFERLLCSRYSPYLRAARDTLGSGADFPSFARSTASRRCWALTRRQSVRACRRCCQVRTNRSSRTSGRVAGSDQQAAREWPCRLRRWSSAAVVPAIAAAPLRGLPPKYVVQARDNPAPLQAAPARRPGRKAVRRRTTAPRASRASHVP